MGSGLAAANSWAGNWPSPALIPKDSHFKPKELERFPLLSQGTVNIPLFFFFPASLQTDKAVARAPNLRGLGKPFLKHTFVTDSDMTAIHCWLIITRKKEKKKKTTTTKEKALLTVGVQRKT